MLTEMANIVREVGRLLLSWRETKGTEGVWEGSQFKAKADLMAHEALVTRLEKLASGVPIISEESKASWLDPRPERYFIIDPIDGTASYAHGFPGFVTQAALVEGGLPTITAIYAPDFEQLYTAKRGQGAHLNGRRLASPKADRLESLIDNYPEPRGTTLRLFRDLNFSRYVECGSISFKICRVADSTADLFFKEVPVRDWDIAAPHLVLEEVGGFLSDRDGNPFRYRGPYEHLGLVAAASARVAQRVLAWYRNLSPLKKESPGEEGL